MMELDIKNFIKIFVLLVLIDLIWLKLVAQKRYQKMILDIQHTELKVKLLPAFLTYVAMTMLFIMFHQPDTFKMFMLGFLSYAVYDLTNLTLLDNFDPMFAIADMVWGGVLFTVVYKTALKINV